MSPELEDAIAHFEDAWRVGRKPAIAPILRDAAASAPASAQRSLAIELVKVDLEYRWRAARVRGRMTALRLEAYAGRLPILGPLAQLPLDLIAEEYRVRRRFGDAPDVQEYFARFTYPQAELAASLEAVDRELAEEGLPVALPVKHAPRLLRRAVDPQAPLFYGDYVLKRQIGTGGLCRVYAGLQLSLRKEVAIKVLRRKFWNSADAVGRFLREAQIVAQLPSEGIVGIHGLGRLPRGGYFMVMDLVDGLDLRVRRDAGGIPLPQVINWVSDVANIVGRIHSVGYLHGDIKPANILVEYAGRVQLTDFGFAQRLHPTNLDHPSGNFGGTPAFLPPELADDSRLHSGPAIDVFGLGGVLFWLLAGRGVHEETRADLLKAALASPTWDAQVADRMPAYVPTEVRELCASCLARDPQARPQLAELIRRLRGR